MVTTDDNTIEAIKFFLMVALCRPRNMGLPLPASAGDFVMLQSMEKNNKFFYYVIEIYFLVDDIFSVKYLIKLLQVF